MAYNRHECSDGVQAEAYRQLKKPTLPRPDAHALYDDLIKMHVDYIDRLLVDYFEKRFLGVSEDCDELGKAMLAQSRDEMMTSSPEEVRAMLATAEKWNFQSGYDESLRVVTGLNPMEKVKWALRHIADMRFDERAACGNWGEHWQSLDSTLLAANDKAHFDGTDPDVNLREFLAQYHTAPMPQLSDAFRGGRWAEPCRRWMAPGLMNTASNGRISAAMEQHVDKVNVCAASPAVTVKVMQQLVMEARKAYREAIN